MTDSLVNADTGEQIAECTPDEARELTDRICTGLGVVWELVLEAYRTRAWAALGHGSWDAYCAAEFGRFHMRLPSEDRDEVIGSLRSAGLSIRAIAATGVASKKTVERTIAASGVANDDTSTVGTDGKTYDAVTRAKASRESQPEPDAPAKCTDGFDCPAQPGPDGLCAWHRGRRKANENTDEGPATPSVPGDSDDATPADVDASPAGDEGTGDTPPTPLVASLPSDWRDRIANAAYLMGCPPLPLAVAMNEDDRYDLAALRDFLGSVLDAYAHRQEQDA